MAVVLVAGVAQATPKSGQLNFDETWSGPIELVGDLTIPTGRKLTISAGTTITAAATDSQGSGANTTSVELIINGGTLEVNGTPANPVVFQGTGVGVGKWWGLRALAGVITLTGATVSGTSYGLDVSGGTVTVNTSTFTSNTYGIYQRATGSSSTVNTSVFVKNTQALYAYLGVINADHLTVVENTGTGAIQATGGTTINLTNSIVSHHTGYALMNSGTLNVSTSDIWSSAGFSGYTLPANNLQTNPLYVDRANGNYRLTSNSPCRQAGTSGSDLGALPYISDATVGWQGTLFTSQTLPAGTVNIIGDLNVAPGVTLTILPGTTLSFATTDSMASGTNSSQVEFKVFGSLVAQGTAVSPITFTTAGTGRDWTGVRIAPGATVSMSHFIVRQAFVGAYLEADVTLSDGQLVNNATGLMVALGNPTLTRLTFTGNGKGLYTNNSSTTTTLSYSVFSRQTDSSIYLYNGTVNADHITVAANQSVNAVQPTGGTTLRLTNSIIAQNLNYQLSVSGTLTPTYSDVWPNTNSGYTWTVGTSGNISSNPNFINVSTDGGVDDFHLQSNSPCIGTAQGGGDMGAFPFSTGTVNSVVITPTSGSVAAGGSLAFTATAYDAANNVVPGATFSWSALPAAGTINSSGVLTASCTAGTVTGAVTVTSSGKSATANVTITPGSPATVTISPSNPSVPSLTTQAFTATVKDSCNNTLTTPVTWSSLSSAGSITSSGVFTAGCTRSNYTNAVTATAGAVSANTAVTVAAGALSALSVSPTAASLSASATQQFSVAGTDSCGNAVTPSATWSTTVPGATISSTGLFTAGTTAGTTVQGVKATQGSIVGAADVTVSGGSGGTVASITLTSVGTVSAGGTLQFTAQALDGSGNPVNGLTYTWSALSAAGTISQSGLLTASCTPATVASAVTVSTSGKTASASVTINPGAAATVVITPSTATLASQGVQAFTAVAKDGCNNTLTTPVTWSANAATGTITSGGSLTAGCVRGTWANGVTATAGAISANASVTVSAGLLTSLSVSPTAATVQQGGTQAFTANGADNCGNPVTVPSVTWATTVAGATISSAGLFTAGTTPGVTNQGVKATAGSLQATANITVQGGSVSQVVITPTNVSLAQGATQQFAAEARDANGNVVTGQPVSWSVMAGGGTIASSGLFTAGTTAGTFTNTVRATVGSASAVTSVTVTPGTPHHIALTPTTVTLAPGGTANFAAQVFDAANNVLTATVTWSALSTAGTITQGGVFTAGSQVGTYSNAVTATVGSVSASASITLSAGALSQLIVAPGVATLTPGTTVAFSVTGRDAQGNPVTVTPTFSVANGGGTITNAGLFTAGNMAGTYPNTVKAEMNGLTAFASVSIQPGPVVYVDVTPNFAQVSAGQTFQFLAQPRDAFGNAVTSQVTWAVADPQVGSLSNTGLLTAGQTNGEFAQVVSASAGGMVGTASVRVIGGTMMQVDAGVDAGSTVSDAGTTDAGSSSMEDAGALDAGSGDTIGITAQPMACGCQSTSGSTVWLLAGLVWLALRRSR